MAFQRPKVPSETGAEDHLSLEKASSLSEHRMNIFIVDTKLLEKQLIPFLFLSSL